MAITRTPWIDDDGTGTTGTVLNNAVKQELYDQIDAAIAATFTVAPWTPTMTGTSGATGVTYTTQVGLYAKSGRVVIATFDLVLSNKGTITGQLQVGGFPVPAGGAPVLYPGLISYATLATTWVTLQLALVTGTSAAYVQGNTAASAANNISLTAADLQNTSAFRGLIVYLTA